MSLNPFIPTSGSTHLTFRNNYNTNILEIESRISGLEGSANPTLDSVTANGATTLNNISVGRIETLHPSNPANDNSAAGNQACSIGGIKNTVSGNRSVSYGGRENEVIGNDSSTIGGFGQVVIGQEAEGLGCTDTTLYTKYTTAIGTINSVVGLSGQGTSSQATKHSAVLGGDTNIIESATEAVIIGGSTNTIQSTHHRSVILGGQNITTDAADTAYVPNLNVGAGFKMPTSATDGYVLTTDANGVGTWQPSAGGQITVSDIDSAAAPSGYVVTADGSGNATWEEAQGGGAAKFSVVTVTTPTYTQITQHTHHLYDDTGLGGGSGSGSGSGSGGACIVVDLLDPTLHEAVTVHKKIGNDCDVLLLPPSGCTIDGVTGDGSGIGYTLTSQYESISIFSDGVSGYYIQ